ncbi:probable beta-D-xylosidase 6 [Phragmites australis]|uniref:probable beta-D-xylosidase 6 n=1 Tax=Phragmites australis TaxID=29695 RepID=UPI002D79DBB1|nr:probable beta-D-xylosidase 6 [Phragmites australis]
MLLAVLSLVFVCGGAAGAAAPANARPCASPDAANAYPFCNASLSIPARARALVSLLTLDEKIAQLSNTAGGAPRLGIPPYQWWSESLHGLADNGPGVNFSSGPVRAATAFPQVILTTAAFNRSLWRAVAEAVAVEARGMHNAGQAGLTYWAPNINIFRDPRWGRGQETSGEDPTVAAAYSIEYVQGFQGEYGEEGRIMLSACCKHYTVYDMEKWEGFARYTFNAKVTEQDLEDTYQPPFKTCIQEGRASCLMCAYNQVNGVPMCAHKDLLQKTRDEWGFQGYITSDCDAVAIIHENQTYTSTDEDSVAIVLKAGMDINCGSFLIRHTKSAIEKGKIQEEDIDRALFNLFSVQLRLGIFDKANDNQLFSRLGPNSVCTKEHRELAAEAVRQGTVLLKNDNSFLPLKRSELRHVAIIGPAANDAYAMGGDYTGVPCNPMTFLKGMQAYVSQTTFAAGCKDVPCNTTDGFGEAIEAAKRADIIVLVAGLNLTEEREDQDRVSLLLPGKQMDLIHSIASVTKKPLVLVLLGGGPVDVSFVKQDPRIASILWVGYPGEVGGQVLPEIIFGEYNPGGKLPITWYPESFTAVSMTDMNMRADASRGYPGRTYRFYTGDVVYGFGYGLSYSKYSYSILQAPKKISLSHSSAPDLISRKPAYIRRDGLDYVKTQDIASCEVLKFSVRISVSNDGDMDGSHVVLLFAKSKSSVPGFPIKQLVGFERVHTAAGSASNVEITVDPCKLMSAANPEGVRVLLLGAHVLMVGDEEYELFIEA